MPENEQWAAIALQNRLNNAKTIRERAAVRSDIERAKTDPAFKSRLAEIARRGRFQSGGWEAAQWGLAGASVLPMLPVIGSAFGGPIGTGLGTAAAAGLGAIGLANVKEGLERREEGLPGATEQLFWGAAEALPGVGWAGKLLRGLRGIKAAPRGIDVLESGVKGTIPPDIFRQLNRRGPEDALEATRLRHRRPPEIAAQPTGQEQLGTALGRVNLRPEGITNPSRLLGSGTGALQRTAKGAIPVPPAGEFDAIHPEVMKRLGQIFNVRRGSAAQDVVDLARSGDREAERIVRQVQQEVTPQAFSPGTIAEPLSPRSPLWQSVAAKIRNMKSTPLRNPGSSPAYVPPAGAPAIGRFGGTPGNPLGGPSEYPFDSAGVAPRTRGPRRAGGQPNPGEAAGGADRKLVDVVDELAHPATRLSEDVLTPGQVAALPFVRQFVDIVENADPKLALALLAKPGRQSDEAVVTVFDRLLRYQGRPTPRGAKRQWKEPGVPAHPGGKFFGKDEFPSIAQLYGQPSQRGLPAQAPGLWGGTRGQVRSYRTWADPDKKSIANSFLNFSTTPEDKADALARVTQQMRRSMTKIRQKLDGHLVRKDRLMHEKDLRNLEEYIQNPDALNLLAAYSIAADRLVTLKKVIQQSFRVKSGHGIPLDYPGGPALSQDEDTLLHLMRAIPGRIIRKGKPDPKHFQEMMKEMNRRAMQLMGLLGTVHFARQIEGDRVFSDAAS